jgi:hypothetical protein
MITIRYIPFNHNDCEGWIERKFNSERSMFAWIARNRDCIELLWFIK